MIAKILTTAMKIQNHETIIKAYLQLYKSEDVKKLVNNAPITFPALPLEHHSPTIAPLPLFPNQLANIVLQAGHPNDCINPLIENRKQKRNRFM